MGMGSRRCKYFIEVSDCLINSCNDQGNVLPPNPPPKVHDKLVTWIEHHPVEATEMITASSDGTVKVWKTSEPAANAGL